MAVDEKWRRLGKMLQNRRVKLAGDPNFAAFARKAGVNAKGEPRHGRTFSNIEKGTQDKYSDAMLVLVEQVYRWAPGSIEAVLEGGEPTELSDGRDSTAPRSLKDPRYTGQVQLVREWAASWYLNVPAENRDHAVDLLIQFTDDHPIADDDSGA